MVNFDSPSVASEQFRESEKKESEMDKIALKIVKDFPNHFLEHAIAYRGMQSGIGLHMYLFNVTSKQSAAYDATFNVMKLDIESVTDAFVKIMKRFGEDGVSVK